MNKKRNRNQKTHQPDNLKAQIRNVFTDKPKKRYNAKQLIKRLELEASVNAVKNILDELHREGLLYETGDNKFRLDRSVVSGDSSGEINVTTYTGFVDMTRSGAAYIITEESEIDIYVPSRYTNGAFDGDTVIVEVRKTPGRKKPEGKIKEVIKRKHTHVMGALHIFERYGVVVPLLHDRSPKVHINTSELEEIENGTYVIAEITNWGMSQNKGIWGRITRILDKSSENEIAMQGIIASNGFEIEFPIEVIDEVSEIEGNITSKDVNERRDFRNVLTFTIDPLTAKDFDDALSIEFIENENIEIGVHIADVTHFVKEGSALDKEALKRSTSVYLVDRVVPMLPEKLSNDLCSLNPNEDKLVFSGTFIFNKEGKLQKTWFGKSIIHSNKRFTYEEAQETMETAQGSYAKELSILNKIAGKLRDKRFEFGSIAFESDEVYFELDENDVPVSVHVKVRKDAHKLVEEFMLLANRKVAEFIARKHGTEIPFVYRIHDEPDPQKLADFALFAKEMGIKMELDTPGQVAKSFNLLAEKAAENQNLKLLEPLAIRTMAKAEYSTNNIGHYGLAFEKYAHFTSPIRRYADVLVHRILNENLKKDYRVGKETLELKCKHISNQERKANSAERESVKYKQVEYIRNHIGDKMEGYISGIIERGVFVALLPSLAEGMIPFDDFDEPFKVPESRLFAKGQRTGKVIKMGDKVNVLIKDADLEMRQIELSFI